MSTFKAKFGGSPTTVTVTLDSLADASARASAKVDNSSNEYGNVHLGGKIKTAGTPSASGYVAIYVCGSNNDSDYDDQHGGADAAHTLLGNAILLHVIKTDATVRTYEFGGKSVAAAFGGVMPKYWALVIENRTGNALDATGSNHEIQFIQADAQSAA